MPHTPQPGWYADPWGAPLLRWWDGTQWSDHTTEYAQAAQVSASQAAPAQQYGHLQGQAPLLQDALSEGKPKGSGRKKLWLFLTAGVAALAVIVTAVIVVPPLFGGGGGGGSAAPQEPVIADGVKYMPAMEIDLSKTDVIEVPSNIGLSELSEKLEAGGESSVLLGGAVDLYADKELKILVPSYQFDTDDGIWEISPSQYSPTARAVWEQYDLGDADYFDEEVPWSQFDEYWMKRNYDADGEKLEYPEVTQIIPKFPEERPAAITPTFAKGAEDGAVKVNWTAPEYADSSTEYLVLKASPGSFALTEEDEAWDIELVGKVQGETSYDSTDYRDDELGTQNAGLQLFSGDSADLQQYAPGDVWRSRLNTSSAQIGIVAVHEGRYSPLDLVTPDAGVRAQPFEIAFWQQIGKDETQRYNVGDLTGLDTWLPVTTLDGATRALPVQIDPDSLNPDIVIQNYGEDGGYVYPDGVGMKGYVLGTVLDETYASYVPEGMTKEAWMAELRTRIQAFNERALQEQPQTGAITLSMEDADTTIDVAEYRKLEPATTTPETEYPVFGTHPMVEHIAANMMEGEKSIDVSEWADAPGAPTPSDAYREAMTQNPLLNYGQVDARFEGNRIYVDYVFDDTQREKAMRTSYEKAEEVADSVEGMDDTEKVRAINQWIVDNATYDSASLAEYEGNSLSSTTGALESTGRTGPGSEFTAWSPIGIFRDGTAVCMGYAQSFVMIARAADLDAIIVSGDVINAGPHAWNRVKIGEEWKSLDPTWNDSDSNPNQYLLINESEYTGTAERYADPNDNWILETNKSQYDTP